MRPLFSLAQIRQAARAGDTLRAWRMFESAGLLDSDEADALSLRGRLLKDRALKSTGSQRAALFEEAEETYLRSDSSRRATYPLINAATIAFLNGKPERARALASETLALLESGEHEPETAYWLGATRAEAEFLLGNIAAGKAAIEQAVAGTPAAWEDHAATIRQLQLIVAQLGGVTGLFDQLLPPASLHFSGLIHLPPEEESVRDLIGTALDQIRPGFVFGALAAGSDILIAEMALDRGAQLHVVLPAPVDIFRDVSVVPFGAHWARRFDSLIEAADAIEVLARDGALSSAAVTLGEEIAMGLTIRRARSLASRAVALRLRRATDGVTPSQAAWSRRGLPICDLAIDMPPRPAGSSLVPGGKRIILASSRALPAIFPPARFEGGAWWLALDDLEQAIVMGIAILRAEPTISLGLVYDVVGDTREEEEGPSRIAAILARSAPSGTIYAAAPGALAIDLWAPDHRFEAAGEVVTPFGDIPVSLFSLAAAV